VRGLLWWSGLALGCLLVAGGVAETVRVLSSGDGGLLFWFGTLAGGGGLILVGTLVMPHRPMHGAVLTTMGCIAGLLPTMWTVIVPVMLVSLAIASVMHASAETEQEASPI